MVIPADITRGVRIGYNLFGLCDLHPFVYDLVFHVHVFTYQRIRENNAVLYHGTLEIRHPRPMTEFSTVPSTKQPLAINEFFTFEPLKYCVGLVSEVRV